MYMYVLVVSIIAFERPNESFTLEMFTRFSAVSNKFECMLYQPNSHLMYSFTNTLYNFEYI